MSDMQEHCGMCGKPYFACKCDKRAVPASGSVQWWVADLDKSGNPTLTDGAHDDRSGCEKALYIMARLGLRPGQRRAICRVEIYPPEGKAHDANEEALKTLNGIGLGQNAKAEQP